MWIPSDVWNIKWNSKYVLGGNNWASSFVAGTPWMEPDASIFVRKTLKPAFAEWRILVWWRYKKETT